MDTTIISIPFLPDEIIRNILIWLPVISLVRFELVCRKWRDMILARDFVDLHQRSSIHELPFNAADFPKANVGTFSHAGLIVLRSLLTEPKIFFILNPARPSNECVKINFSRDFPGYIYAVYYHPSLKEYCSLWIVCQPFPNSPKIQVLNLGSNPSFKTVCDSFDYTYKEHDERYPLFVNHHLYWMLMSARKGKFSGHNDILEFDIISEEFMIIPCPIPLNTECTKHQTHLLNSDGVLCFLLILPDTITIWKMKDHLQHSWVITEYSICLEVFKDLKTLGIIAFIDGMLAYRYKRRLFVCNLSNGTLKMYPEEKYNGNVFFLSHQMSLARGRFCV